jgi:hypothetical protein
MKNEITARDLRFNPKKYMSKKAVSKNINAISESANKTENLKDLNRYKNYWEALSDFRTRAIRNRNFAQVNQWQDVIYDPEIQKYCTEEYHIRRKGRQPLTQNIIQPIINNLVGQFLNNETQIVVTSRTKEGADEAEILSNAIQAVGQLNSLPLIDSQMYEMYTLTGVAIQKMRYKYIKERNEKNIFIENCNPHRIFFNSDISDIRGTDLRCIGQIIDCTLDDIISSFSLTKADEEKIKNWYKYIIKEPLILTKGLDTTEIDNISFLIPPTDKCRVIEAWELKSEWRTYVHDELTGEENIVNISLSDVDKLNKQRIEVYKKNNVPEELWALVNAQQIKEQFWYGKYMTPTGDILWEGESPFEHQEHPFIITCAPLIDGKVKGFVEDLISPQKSINRNMMLQDFIIAASAKGALLVPATAIPEDMTPETFADQWTKFDAVIVYTPKAGVEPPRQISEKSTNIGLYEILASQLQFTQDISGVHSAIQGKNIGAGAPASLYAQEAQNSTLNTLKHMTIFEKFLEKRDYKTLKMIMQFYDTERYISVAGNAYKSNIKKYVPEDIRKMEYDLVRSKAVNTPVYRQLIDDKLSGLLQAGLISLEMYLENSAMPFSDKLLDALNKQKESLQGQGQPPTPEQVQSIQQGANPQAMKMLNQQNQ